MNDYINGSEYESYVYSSESYTHHIVRGRDQRGYEIRVTRNGHTPHFEDNYLVVEEADILALRADALPFLH